MKLYKYQDKKGEHRWRLVARNGRILADSGEGYTTAKMRDKGLKAVIKALFYEQFDEWLTPPPKH
jgi:uncharacterized protein YegP (UPF0339 family)